MKISKLFQREANTGEIQEWVHIKNIDTSSLLRVRKHRGKLGVEGKDFITVEGGIYISPKMAKMLLKDKK